MSGPQIAVIAGLAFAACAMLFVYCYFRPDTSMARTMMESGRYPRFLGRSGFLVLAAGSIFLAALAGWKLTHFK